MIRNLIWAACLFYGLYQWFTFQPAWFQWIPAQPTQSSLFTLPDFHVSGTVVLTDCYLLNHWWIAIIQAFGPSFFIFLNKIEETSYFYSILFLRTKAVWFGKAPRKPLDKTKLFIQP